MSGGARPSRRSVASASARSPWWSASRAVAPAAARAKSEGRGGRDAPQELDPHLDGRARKRQAVEDGGHRAAVGDAGEAVELGREADDAAGGVGGRLL